MALTPNDVLNKQFQTTRFRDGYDQDEVDDFLDEVLAEFQRLIAENEQLKGQPAAAPSGDSGEVATLRERLADAEARLAATNAQLAEAQQALQTAQQQAAAGSAQLDGMNSAEYLQLARRVHEEHVREGVVKRDNAIAEGEAKAAELVAEAQRRHDQLLADAQSESERVRSEAQSQAESLIAEARDQRDADLRTLADEVVELSGERDSLQAAVDDLKEFERGYRASLKSHLESQLAELQAVGTEDAAATDATGDDAALEDTGSAAAASDMESEGAPATPVPPYAQTAPAAETSETDPAAETSTQTPASPFGAAPSSTGEQPTSGFGGR